MNATLYVDLKKAGKLDNLRHSVDYGAAFSVIKKAVTEESYNLLETLAENIAKDLFSTFKVLEKVALEIQKPEAPVEGTFDYFGIKIFRERS